MDSIKAKEDFRGFIACINSVAPEKHKVKLRAKKEGEKVNRRERGRKIRKEREINREREGGR